MIAWLNDTQNFGGAELTNKEYIKRSPYKIDQFNATTFKTDSEYYILNNVRSFTKEQLRFISNKKYVIFWHDALSFHFTHNIELNKQIIKNSLFHFFLSPAHKKQIQNLYGVTIVNSAEVMPYIDVSIFHNTNGARKRDKENCWVGNIYPHKGIDNALMYAKNNGFSIDFYGKGDELITYNIRQSKYANYVGDIKNECLPDIYRNYINFIHMPSSFEACGRSIIEAYLCGCKLKCNQNIGFLSYNIIHNEIDVINFIIKSPSEFWEYVTKAFSL